MSTKKTLFFGIVIVLATNFIGCKGISKGLFKAGSSVSKKLTIKAVKKTVNSQGNDENEKK